MDYAVRKATCRDCDSLAAFLQRLVSLRNEPGLVTQNGKDLYRDGFSLERPKFAAFLAESPGPEEEMEVIGFALYSTRYHSFVGPGLHLNNLFVMEEHRGKGVATQLLKKVIKEGLKQGCRNMGFMSNSWNHIAKNLYRKMGAVNWTELYGLHAYEFVKERSCAHVHPIDGVVIRKARVDDVGEMARLLNMYRESQTVCMMETIQASVLKENGFQSCPKFFSYVAERQSINKGAERRLVGILTYSYAYCSHSSTTVSLDAVYVDDEYRRQGIACNLFKTFIQDEAEKNHTKIRIFVDSSIDCARDFLNHVNAVDQSERAQWIWSLVSREDLTNYTDEEDALENGLTNGETSVNGLANGETSVNGLANGEDSSNVLVNGEVSTNALANGEASVNGIANGEASVNGLTNGEGSVNGLVNGKAYLNGHLNGQTNGKASSYGLTNGEASYNDVTNGEACLNGLTNGYSTDLTNGDASSQILAKMSVKNVTKANVTGKSLANGNAHLKSVAHGNASLKSVANGDASLKSVANGDAFPNSLTNGEDLEYPL